MQLLCVFCLLLSKYLNFQSLNFHNFPLNLNAMRWICGWNCFFVDVVVVKECLTLINVHIHFKPLFRVYLIHNVALAAIKFATPNRVVQFKMSYITQ